MHERGNKPGKYVMARYDDVGAYEPGNVEIITFEENTIAGRVGCKHSAKARAKMSKSRVQLYQDPDRGPVLLEVIGKSSRERFKTSESRVRHGAAISAGQNNPIARAKMSATARRRPRDEFGHFLPK
jgi:hypothetical protein